MNKLNNSSKELFGAIVGLAKVCGNYPYTEQTIENIKLACKAILDDDNVNMKNLIEIVNESKYTLSPNCRFCASPCENSANRDFSQLEDEENFEAKADLLFSLAEFSRKDLSEDDEFSMLKGFALLDDKNITNEEIKELKVLIKI